MKLLFLDTETTGLSPTNSQIIELAAVLVTLNPATLDVKIEDKFESLVALRTQMDDRITRITGITNEDLQIALPIHKVQEKWFSFLSQTTEPVTIVGHSLSFDLAFLKSESWFLPENHKVCDTLEISKILLPEVNAINLEFLVEKLGLKPRADQLKAMNIVDETLLKAHRALYDSLTCLNLFNHLLSSLKNLRLDQLVYTKISQFFLPLDLVFFSDSKPNKTIEVSNKKASKMVQIYFGGSVVEQTLFEKVNNQNTDFCPKLINLIRLDLPKDLMQILLQIYVIEFKKERQNELNFKIHGKSPEEFLFADQVYKSLSDRKEIINKSEYTGVLSQFENVISQVKYVSEHNYRLTDFINLLELYLSASNSADKASPHSKQIQEITACYDFLMLNLQPFWQKSEYYYIPNQLKPEEELLRKKITELYHLLSRLETKSFEVTNPILNQLSSAIAQSHTSFFDDTGSLQIAPSNRLLFRQQGTQVSISTFVRQFNLNTIFSNTLDSYKSLVLETYLKKDDFTALLKITGLASVVSDSEDRVRIEYKGRDDLTILFPEAANTKLTDFLEERNDVTKKENKYSLLLCGQNSSLKEIERSFTQEYNPDEYLVLGESGSLTKVVSKMIKNQKGMVAVKNGDFYYISRYLSQIQISEIWIINQPYFSLHKYWQTLALNSTDKDEYTSSIKWLYLKSQAAYISEKTGLNVHFLKSYRA